MMTRASSVVLLSLALCLFISSHVNGQDPEPPPRDTLPSDSIPANAVQPPPTDSTTVQSDSLRALLESLGIEKTEEKKKPEQVYPPTRLIDTLVEHFSRNRYPFDVQEMDLFPRNAAAYLERDASYFIMTAQETPLRTAVIPYGLTGRRITVRSGPNELEPYDRTVPMDGLTDFDDIATGDIGWGGLLEGPLAGYNSLAGNPVMLYLEPFPIPQQVARSQFTVERGSYGYAYTRGRIARTFAPGFGFAVSTDYRTGEGFISNADDDCYNIKTRMYKYLPYKSRLDLYYGVYRRKGGYSFYRRLRRDQQLALSLSSQEKFGGQVTATYNLNLSRSADPFKTIRPRNTYTDLSYLRPFDGGLYRFAFRFGREQYYINQLYTSRFYGFADLSGYYPYEGGRLFFFARARDAENENIDFDAAIGYAWRISDRWNVVTSVGRLTAWPDLTELYQMLRSTGGEYPERGNPQLAPEEKLAGNAAVFYTRDKFELSASLNTVRITDFVYYDQRYDPDLMAFVTAPANEDRSVIDFNLSGSFHDLWLFYGAASATVRRVESNRYDDRPPYSPRWQLYGQGGMKIYIAKYNVHARLFGDITWTEKPLSYDLDELQTLPVFSGGVTAHLKNLTFYYIIHNMSNQPQPQPEGYGYSGWFYSWGINFRMLN